MLQGQFTCCRIVCLLVAVYITYVISLDRWDLDVDPRNVESANMSLRVDRLAWSNATIDSNYVITDDINPKTVFVHSSNDKPVEDTAKDRSSLENNNSTTRTTTIGGDDDDDNQTGFPPSLLTPQEPVAYYLDGKNQDSIGLGHAFMSFSHLVTAAVTYNLTAQLSFVTKGHGISKEESRRYFFNDMMMTPLAVPGGNRSLCNVVSVDPVHFLSDLYQKREAFLKSKNVSSPCVIFTVVYPGPREDRSGSLIPGFRKMFEKNEPERKKVIERKPASASPSEVRVVVHIRRGDLFRYLKGKPDFLQKEQQGSKRLIPLSAYVSVLTQLFGALFERGVRSVNLYLFSEGMKPPAQVLAVDETFVDLREAIEKGSPAAFSGLNVTFYEGDSRALQAFDDGCFSDVLITGASGFSHLMAQLCRTPLVLATPFWHSFSYVPNSILLDATRSSFSLPTVLQPNETMDLIDHLAFNETRFDELWYSQRKA